MTTRDEPWPEGTPSWADLMVPDRQAAKAFYGGLFGWEFTDGGSETGNYVQAHLGGRPVAGIGEAPADQPDEAPMWTTYLAVDDADLVAGRISEAGGVVLVPPMEVGAFGRMAIAADPGGAVFGLWQNGAHIGARLIDEPGTMCWNEVTTKDLHAAKAFYRSVFGYGLLDLSGPELEYVALELDGRTVATLGAISGEMQSQPSWLISFAVENTDAAAARVVDLGGTISGQPRDSAYGRMALVTGPAGETFAIITPTDERGGVEPVG